MIRRLIGVVAALGSVACTEVVTDPNAVVALRFDGSAYPSIVARDSLRDSLGALQPLLATALNYRGEPVEDAVFAFSSPDTVLRVFDDGVVYATVRKPDGTPARVFATVGTLQSQPDSLVVVQRADSIAGKTSEIVPVAATADFTISQPDSLRFFVYGDTATTGPPATVPAWLVSFQLRYKGTLIAPNDTSVAFMFVPTNTTPPDRRLMPIDTTDAQGKATRQLVVKSIPTTVTEDTIFVIATIRTRRSGDAPITAQTMVLLRRGTTPMIQP